MFFFLEKQNLAFRRLRENLGFMVLQSSKEIVAGPSLLLSTSGTMCARFFFDGCSHLTALAATQCGHQSW